MRRRLLLGKIVPYRRCVRREPVLTKLAAFEYFGGSVVWRVEGIADEAIGETGDEFGVTVPFAPFVEIVWERIRIGVVGFLYARHVNEASLEKNAQDAPEDQELVRRALDLATAYERHDCVGVVTLTLTSAEDFLGAMFVRA